MWMDCCAEDSARRNTVYMAALPPPAGELRTICASMSPLESRRRRGKYTGPPIAPPVASRQVSSNAHRALELLDARPLDADVGVAPVSALLAVTAPFAADAGASGHAHHAVDDE